MQVYVQEPAGHRLIGRADVAENQRPIFDVPGTTTMERFGIEAILHLRPDGRFEIERAVVLTPGQSPEALPGWAPLPEQVPCDRDQSNEISCSGKPDC
jgi:hypothetical protein